ncbi:hypothetical protein HXX76_008488 [Chlamydomonas incerta]|uniref:Uncharacterized protein n=1 Tax=Chlamydomonas incerta TaxID=51695 RepID=A0A835T8A3_CHLIN|nr:hypothetical protein HXX76_008488 [Chlamydomonas incerta]|eukprot:KAG2433430.1 hypothetical protein HXX76_008488 [Chlamydomonas incerta]
MDFINATATTGRSWGRLRPGRLAAVALGVVVAVALCDASAVGSIWSALGISAEVRVQRAPPTASVLGTHRISDWHACGGTLLPQRGYDSELTPVRLAAAAGGGGAEGGGGGGSSSSSTTWDPSGPDVANGTAGPWPGYSCGPSSSCYHDRATGLWFCRPLDDDDMVGPVNTTLTGGAAAGLQRGRQCGGAGGECGRWSRQPCVDAAWPGAACAPGLACVPRDGRMWECADAREPQPRPDPPVLLRRGEQCGGAGGVCGEDGGGDCVDREWEGFECYAREDEELELVCGRETRYHWTCMPAPELPSGPLPFMAQCGGVGGRCGSAGRPSCLDRPWRGFDCGRGLACLRESAASWVCGPQAAAADLAEGITPAAPNHSPTEALEAALVHAAAAAATLEAARRAQLRQLAAAAGGGAGACEASGAGCGADAEDEYLDDEAETPLPPDSRSSSSSSSGSSSSSSSTAGKASGTQDYGGRRGSPGGGSPPPAQPPPSQAAAAAAASAAPSSSYGTSANPHALPLPQPLRYAPNALPGSRLCWSVSYWRGWGQAPNICDMWRPVYSGGRCYPPCPPGFDTRDGALCWMRRCPPGWQDDGTTCFLPPHRYAKGCCRVLVYGQCSHCCDACLPGYGEEACACSRQAEVFSRSSGWDPGVAARCPLSRTDRDAEGACYVPCRHGHAGIADRCWLQSPSRWMRQQGFTHRCGILAFARSTAAAEAAEAAAAAAAAAVARDAPLSATSGSSHTPLGEGGPTTAAAAAAAATATSGTSAGGSGGWEMDAWPLRASHTGAAASHGGLGAALAAASVAGAGALRPAAGEEEANPDFSPEAEAEAHCQWFMGEWVRVAAAAGSTAVASCLVGHLVTTGPGGLAAVAASGSICGVAAVSVAAALQELINLAAAVEPCHHD